MLSHLTSEPLFDKMYNMKKVTARQFQHRFGKTAQALQPGQSVTITNRGKPLGLFTRLPARRIKTPNFLANLQATGVSKELGNQILQEFHDSLS